MSRKFVDIEGLCASGVWVRIFRLEVLSTITDENAESLRKCLAEQNGLVTLKDKHQTVRYDPKNFLAICVSELTT